jgi:DHA3 family macrolide efflux protein-like MFS transporter
MNTADKNNNTFQSGWKLPFFTIWTGQAFSLLGSALVGFALIWWMTETTGSATVLATAAMFEFLPRVFVGPLAGTLVDRWNRRQVMLIADTTTALATAVLIYLAWAGNLQIWQIYLLMLVRSSAGAFHMPAMLSSTSLMVPEEQLMRVQGLNQLLQGLINIAAPVLGALLIAIFPLHAVLAVDLGTAMLAVLPLLLIFIPQPKVDPSQDENKATVWGDMRTGFRYVWDWAGLRNIVLLAVFINLISLPAITLMPLLVKNEFAGGAMEIASMQSSWAIGFLIGGILLSVWGGFRRKILTANLAMFGTAIGLVMVGLAHNLAFEMALAGIFIAGMMNVLLNGPAFALLQTVVADDMQGRVLSLVISLANAMTPIGLLIAGPVAENTGVSAFFIFASLMFVVSGIFTIINADIQKLEETGNRIKAEQDATLTAASTAVTGD